MNRAKFHDPTRRHIYRRRIEALQDDYIYPLYQVAELLDCSEPTARALFKTRQLAGVRQRARPRAAYSWYSRKAALLAFIGSVNNEQEQQQEKQKI